MINARTTEIHGPKLDIACCLVMFGPVGSNGKKIFGTGIQWASRMSAKLRQ